MKLNLINEKDSEFATELLSEYYKNDFIPAEKKTYIPDLAKSYGPYLGVKTKDGSTSYLMDAASQIATLGLGLSPSAYYGVLHHMHSLTGDKKDINLKRLQNAFQSLMTRITSWEHCNLTYCHSGAEANEIALGECFQNRVHQNAKKVLAFEDSFHGRMQITLSSTWNPAKRATFEWADYLTDFIKIPASSNGQFINEIPEEWINYWSNSTIHFNNSQSFPFKQTSTLLREEYDALNKIKSSLASKEYFAVIIEPMQCEGGDRYLTNTFMNALLLIAKSYDVPIIMDEVQTGFHLGKKFFWHQEFLMKDHNDTPLDPDYIICAKKAQIGIVLSKSKIKFNNLPEGNEFCNSSLLRGYIQASLLNEQSAEIQKINIIVKKKLQSFIKKYHDDILDTRSNGLAFSFDFHDSQYVTSFVKERFNFGLLFYPAGSNTLRFRLTIAFKEQDIAFLFDQLDTIASLVLHKKQVTPCKFIERNYHKFEIEHSWHDFIIQTKQNEVKNWSHTFEEAKSLFRKDFSDLKIIEIDRNNFNLYKKQIIALEEDMYEETRQTDISKFELAANQKPSFCFALIDNKQQLSAICFSGTLSLFPYEKGIKRDPDFKKNNSLYMLDTTVSKNDQGQSLGKILKYIHLLKANSYQILNISGRNRQVYAKHMFSINLSLGAIEQFYLEEDYLDDLEYRGALYYKYPASYQDSSIDLSNKSHSFDKFNLQKSTGSILNKICLSNFASDDFLSNLKIQSSRVNQNLRHIFSTSGQSECIDKIVKSLWVTSEQRSNQLCSFNGHYFGHGSFLARSLSSSNDCFFPVTHFDHPTDNNYKTILANISKYLDSNTPLAFFIEPFTSLLGLRVPQLFLIELKQMLKDSKTKLIYNETSSSLYRYSDQFDMLSSNEILMPDGSMNYLGGQAGIVYLRNELHFNKPLMMISTWDGDEYSFHAATETYLNIDENRPLYQKNLAQFDSNLKQFFSKLQNSQLEIQNGAGYLIGSPPLYMKDMLTFYNNKYLILPSWENIIRFNERFNN